MIVTDMPATTSWIMNTANADRLLVILPLSCAWVLGSFISLRVRLLS